MATTTVDIGGIDAQQSEPRAPTPSKQEHVDTGDHSSTKRRPVPAVLLAFCALCAALAVGLAVGLGAGLSRETATAKRGIAAPDWYVPTT